MKSVTEFVKELLKSVSDAEEFRPYTHLSTLDIDSIDISYFSFDIEKEYGFTISDPEITKIASGTVGELIEFIEAKIKK